MHYDEAFAGLAGVRLEDSWVLRVAPSDHGLSLRLQVVLAPEHQFYAPEPGEQHCYRLGRLSLRTKTPLDLRLGGNRPAADASGESDCGHVDAFEFNSAEDRWELEGDWGHAAVRDPELHVPQDPSGQLSR